MPAIIEFKEVHKYYGKLHVLRGINATVAEGTDANYKIPAVAICRY